jgi:hypothetical protein
MAINFGNRQFWQKPQLDLVPKLTYWNYYKSIPAPGNSGKGIMPELNSNDFNHF